MEHRFWGGGGFPSNLTLPRVVSVRTINGSTMGPHEHDCHYDPQRTIPPVSFFQVFLFRALQQCPKAGLFKGGES